MTEKVLILEPERVIQTTVSRKPKVVHVEVNGEGRTSCCSKGRRLKKRGICYHYDGKATI